MHVTLVSGIDPTDAHVGGTRTYVLGLAEHLQRRNVSVCLVGRDGGATPIPGVEYVRVRSGPSSARFLVGLAAHVPSLTIPRDSVIHAQRPDDLLPFQFSKPGHPTLCTLHGIPALAVARRRGLAAGTLYRGLEWMGLARVDRTIAVNDGTARWYKARYPRLASRMRVIPVGIDQKRFRPLDRDASRDRYEVKRRHAVLCAGRLSVEKRVEAAVRAVEGLHDTELLIAGIGREEGRLREMAHGLPVRFLGAVPHEDMPDLISAADLLLLPSEYEGLPTIALEALACGVPVIATPAGGLSDLVVAGKNGWLVEDPDQLGSTIAYALPQVAAMRDSCVSSARLFSWERIVDQILSVYREVAD